MPETSANVVRRYQPNHERGHRLRRLDLYVPTLPRPGRETTSPLIIGGVAGHVGDAYRTDQRGLRGRHGNPGLVLYQDPNTQANDGFDAEAGDGAAVTLNGVVYNASLAELRGQPPRSTTGTERAAASPSTPAARSRPASEPVGRDGRPSPRARSP